MSLPPSQRERHVKHTPSPSRLSRHSAISPKIPLIHFLPPEILGEIFFCCLSRYPSVTEDGYDLAPLLLLMVCRFWKHVALNTPQLWTILDFKIPILRSKQVYKTWLYRAGPSLPIDYTFGSHYYDSGAFSPDTFTESFPRIQTLTGGIPESFFENLHRRWPLNIEAPDLEEIDVGQIFATKGPKPICSSALEEMRGAIRTPKLRSLGLRGSTFTLPLFSFDPKNVRELRLQYKPRWNDATNWSYSSFVDSIPSTYVNLEKLTITVFATMCPPTLVPVTSTFPNLKDLSIETYSDFDPTPFLRKFDVPNLEHLALRAEYCIADMDAEEITEIPVASASTFLEPFFERGIPQLRSLTLERFSISYCQIIPWLSKLEALESLRFIEGEMDRHTIEGLIYQGSSATSICPALSDLYFDWVDFPDLDAKGDNVFSPLLKSRVAGGLHNFRLRPKSPIRPDHREELTNIARASGRLICTV